MAKIYQFPKIYQEWEEDEFDKQYREYYQWEEDFYLEHGYYSHNAPYYDEDESNSKTK